MSTETETAEQNYQRAIAEVERLAARLEGWRAELADVSTSEIRLDDEHTAALVRGDDALADTKSRERSRVRERHTNLEKMIEKLSADVVRQRAAVYDGPEQAWADAEEAAALETLRACNTAAAALAEKFGAAQVAASSAHQVYLQAAGRVADRRGHKNRQDALAAEFARLLGEQPDAAPAVSETRVIEVAAAPVVDHAPVTENDVPGLYEIER